MPDGFHKDGRDAHVTDGGLGRPCCRRCLPRTRPRLPASIATATSRRRIRPSCPGATAQFPRSGTRSAGRVAFNYVYVSQYPNLPIYSYTEALRTPALAEQPGPPQFDQLDFGPFSGP